MKPNQQIEPETELFVNPNGKLCRVVSLFGKEKYVMIDVRPVFDGYDVNGNIINEEDYHWEAIGISMS